MGWFNVPLSFDSFIYMHVYKHGCIEAIFYLAKLLDLSCLGDVKCEEQRACRYYGIGGMISCHVLKSPVSPGCNRNRNKPSRKKPVQGCENDLLGR